MEVVRVLRQPMTHGSRPGTFAMVTAAAIDDVRMGAAPLRVLVALGHYRDADGWCWPKQRHLADRLGISQQAVSKALRSLGEMGYIEIHDQYDAATGARISSRYRVFMDYVLPVEFQRTPQPDVVGSQLQVVGATTSRTIAPQRDVVAIEEELTQRNKPEEQPKKDRTHVRSPKPPTAQRRVIDLIVAGGAPSPTFGGRAGKAVKEAGDPELVAAAYLAAWRGDWGDDWLRDNLSIHAVVDRLDGFRGWLREQAPEPQSHVNGTTSKPLPVTPDDLAVWDRALESLRGFMNDANFEGFIAPLEVGGRMESGGLCLIVPSGVGTSVARFKDGIYRALMDAGDPAPTAVAFKARRSSREASHAE